MPYLESAFRNSLPHAFSELSSKFYLPIKEATSNFDSIHVYLCTREKVSTVVNMLEKRQTFLMEATTSIYNIDMALPFNSKLNYNEIQVQFESSYPNLHVWPQDMASRC